MSSVSGAVAGLAVLFLASCSGGSKNQPESLGGPDPRGTGETAVGTGGELDAADGGLPATDAGPPPVDAAPPPPVMFSLVNLAEQDLVFSMDRGWQPILFAYSGQPPKAKSVLMFPKFCTASCETEPEGRCPYCPEPESVKEVKAAEKREVVAGGQTLEVPWDAQVFVYEKTRGTRDGRKKRCKCYRAEPIPAAEYTVKACGLRITKSADASSKYQCAAGTMLFPSEEPQVIRLEFPAVELK